MDIYYIAKDVVYLYEVYADSKEEAIYKARNENLPPYSEEVISCFSYHPPLPTIEGDI